MSYVDSRIRWTSLCIGVILILGSVVGGQDAGALDIFPQAEGGHAGLRGGLRRGGPRGRRRQQATHRLHPTAAAAAGGPARRHVLLPRWRDKKSVTTSV